jgi:hypothetical protein
LTERPARLVAARFQSQRVGEVLGKIFVGEHFFQDNFTLAALQTFEGRDENFRCGFGCAHAANVADVGRNDKPEGKTTTEDLLASIFSRFYVAKQSACRFITQTA